MGGNFKNTTINANPHITDDLNEGIQTSVTRFKPTTFSSRGYFKNTMINANPQTTDDLKEATDQEVLPIMRDTFLQAVQWSFIIIF
jgi:hypothetical protein